MTAVAILSVFAGMFLGMRFKILATLPVIVAVALTASAVMAAQDAPLLSILAGAALSALAVQIGYLCGSFAPFVKHVPEPAVVSSAERPSAAPLSRHALLRD
ncbi:MAG: hypothetical protein WCA36_05025 [Pseudolabrys sp.]